MGRRLQGTLLGAVWAWAAAGGSAQAAPPGGPGTVSAGVLDRPVGLDACDAYRKLIRCRLEHAADAERANVRPKVLASLARVRRAVQTAGRSGKKKISDLCSQHVFELKRAFGHMDWFGTCLLAVRPCPAGTRLQRVKVDRGRAQWCQRKSGKGVGRKHGPMATWHPNGRLAAMGGYLNGRRHGRWTEYFASTVLKKSDGFFHRGKKHGQWTQYFESGQEKSRQEWSRGKRHGRFSSYRSSGRLEFIGAYRNGKKHGIWIHWNPKGRKSVMVVWERGKKTEEFFYNRQGRSIRTCRYRAGRKWCRRM